MLFGFKFLGIVDFAMYLEVTSLLLGQLCDCTNNDKGSPPKQAGMSHTTAQKKMTKTGGHTWNKCFSQ